MTRFRPRRPSPALIIATIALLIAMGGTGYAAFKLPTNSVGTKRLKNGAVTTKKLNKNATIANATNAVNATHATSATSAGSAASATYATSAGSAASAASAATAGSAQPVAFARVSTTGVINQADSKNVGSVTVVGGSSNIYCFSGLPFTPTGAQVTPDLGGLTPGEGLFVPQAVGACPANTQASVETVNTSGSPAPLAFFIELYG